ncbi:MAG: TetR/AcrR family transcriptional regulator, partial [Bacillota bacterium]|nr:TetR/AcrR family transcriptional regulator [Bacillota bacterium]
MELKDLFSASDDGEALTPEERIKRATLVCIEENGLDGTTVRVIAAKADLNPAAVNYYYRSKERLIEEALRSAWVYFMEDIEKITSEIGSPRDKVDLIARYIVEGACRNPKVLRAIIAEHATLRAESSAYLHTIFGRLAARGGFESDPALGSSLLLAFGLLLGFAANSVAEITGLDLSRAEARIELASRVSASLFRS